MPTAMSPVAVPGHELGPWRAAWDDLVERQPLPSPFQRSWWLEAVAPADACYLLIRSGDELLGGLALGVRRWAGLDRYAVPGPAVLCPDHLDAIAAPGAEDVVARGLERWFARPGQRVLDLRGVVPGSLLHRAVGGRAQVDDVAPYQPLQQAPHDDGFLASRSSGFRRNVRRGRRRLAERGLHHRRLPESDVLDGLRELRRLHEDRPGRDALLGAMPLLAAAVTAGARLGEARIDVLSSEHETVAVSVAFELAGRLSLYQIARSTEPEHASAGTVLLAAVVEDARRRGCREVDLLRGDEDYKSSFADGSRPLLRLRAAHGGLAGGLLRAEDLARSVSATLRSRAGSDA